jgi:hypothetical protein
MRWLPISLGLLWISVLSVVASSEALPGDDFENPPVSYYDSPSRDRVAVLWQDILAGKAELVADERGSYLPSLLELLDVPVSSQCLVFSKTSLQINHISPRKPRAIYFNDDCYVGTVQGSNIIELTAIDDSLGSVFYTLELPSRQIEEAPEKPTIIRDRGQCLSCHATTRTERVPGVLVRSVYADKAGRPRSGSSSYVSDHRSPFLQRWGGWYVTGSHGAMRHMGNVYAVDREDPQGLDMESGANLEKLPSEVSRSGYLSEESDIVALMVLEHQTRVHNLITRANYESRQATHLDKAMNQALGRAADYVSESTERRIAAVSEELVKALLFADEYELTDKVVGSKRFQDDFLSGGPVDSQGRSLRDFDLSKYMFKNRCSFLLLSKHFDGLPEPVMRVVKSRMTEVLVHGTDIPQGVVIDDRQRAIIVGMLNELKPDWLEVVE